MKKIITLILIFVVNCFISFDSISQQTLTGITGIVYDAKGGKEEPIIGATVMVRGTKFGTVTAVDGTFTLLLPVKAGMMQSYNIVISYVGYKTETILVPIKSGLLTNMQIALEEDDEKWEVI